ncbi:MAG: tetratricopeptide repeat protein [Eubacteriales bacterium]|jgi:cytochrome c-type biogenesis protein CcmH/NrfG
MPKNKKTNYHEKRRNKQKIVFIILAVVLSVGLIGSSIVWIAGGSSQIQSVENEKQNVTLQDSIKSLEASVKSNPDNAVALTGLARAYVSAGRYKDAFGMYERAVQKTPDNSDLVLELAAMGYQLGEFDKTIQYLEGEIKRHPVNAQAYYFRGIVFAGKKDYKKGIQDVEKFISMTKDSDEKAKAMQMIKEWKANLPATG